MEADELVRLDTIACGAAVELFDMELQKILANIADPNTDPEKVRSITIKVSIFPNKARDSAEVVVGSGSKIVPVQPAAAVVFFGKKEGRRVAVEHDPRQTGLFDSSNKPTLVPLRGGEEQK